jgi:excisionase family DNA binding protein
MRRTSLDAPHGAREDLNGGSSDGPGKKRRPLLTARSAGAYTGLGERYIRRLRAERRIPCVRIGGRVLFDPDDLDCLIEAHREPAVVEVRR